MDLAFPLSLLVSFLFFGVAFLYSSVGHGGASGYLAVLSFFSLVPDLMASTALILNLLVAGTALVTFLKASYVEEKLTLPFIITSIPLAFLGGMIHVSIRVYELLLAGALLVAGMRFLFETYSPQEETRVNSPSLAVSLPVGGGIGFVSGLVGVGGGIFLSPLMLVMKWADAKRTAAASAAFIFVNSIAGLSGRVAGGNFQVGTLFPLLAAAFVGGLVGSHYGAVKYSGRTIRRILGIVLLVASAKLIVSAILSSRTF
jgi:uncharacterized membrane protein YfcA